MGENDDSNDAAAAEVAFKLMLFTGKFQRLPVENGWHEGTISVAQNTMGDTDTTTGKMLRIVLEGVSRDTRFAGASTHIVS